MKQKKYYWDKLEELAELVAESHGVNNVVGFHNFRYWPGTDSVILDGTTRSKSFDSPEDAILFLVAERERDATR